MSGARRNVCGRFAMGTNPPTGTFTKQQALTCAYDADVVCADEFLLHLFPSREARSHARVQETGAPPVAVACGRRLPHITWHDRLWFEEVSIGYPRQRRRRVPGRSVLRGMVPVTEQM